MKGNPKRPPWSQPMCQDCYVKRFNARCTIVSPWPRKEFCFDCEAVTDKGIYLDIRPPQEKQRGRGRGASRQGEYVDKWVRENGEYRGDIIPGSAE